MRAWRPDEEPNGESEEDVIQIQDYIEEDDEEDDGLCMPPHQDFLRKIYGNMPLNELNVENPPNRGDESEENFRRNEEYVRRKKALKNELHNSIAQRAMSSTNEGKQLQETIERRVARYQK